MFLINPFASTDLKLLLLLLFNSLLLFLFLFSSCWSELCFTIRRHGFSECENFIYAKVLALIGVAGKLVSHKTAGILSTIFDVGGVFGGISAGFISDKISARAITSVLFLLLSIPSLILYRTYGSMSMHLNLGLMLLSGYFVNGPYSLITTAVAADLGTQDMIKGNSRALATVTAIIDGTGSVGAALGPVLTGYISTRGWNSVFFMLIVSISFAIIFLIHLAKSELVSKMSEQK